MDADQERHHLSTEEEDEEDHDYVPSNEGDDDDQVSLSDADADNDQDQSYSPQARYHSTRFALNETNGILYIINQNDGPAINVNDMTEFLIGRYGRAGRALVQNISYNDNSDESDDIEDEEDEDDNNFDEEYENEDEDDIHEGWLYNTDDEEDEDGDDLLFASVMGSRRQGRRSVSKRKKIFKDRTSPCPEGVALQRSGEFGRPPEHLTASQRKLKKFKTSDINNVLERREQGLHSNKFSQDFGRICIPNSSGVEVAKYEANVYSGQFSQDGSFFYTCAQDFLVRLYETSSPPSEQNYYNNAEAHHVRHRQGLGYGSELTTLKNTKTFSANEHYSTWTITDANLSHDNNWMIYSTIGPIVSLVKVRDSEDDTPRALDLCEGLRRQFGVWSLRFSADSKELVAGASRGYINVYDIEARKSLLRIQAHHDDVNAVCFADTDSSNVLVSGSDDSFLKIWDRRSLRSNKPSGVLVGHTEGLTYVSPKGDGRYCISNGKDQTCKLWDLRMMYSEEEFERLEPKDCSVQGFDYRHVLYKRPRYKKHPHDRSVVTFTGHTVMRTLIRCHFSPQHTTGQQYIYSGSADGRIHIWNLDGTIAKVIDRKHTSPMFTRSTGQINLPSDPDPSRPKDRNQAVVRDVAWHPYLPYLMSTSWGGSGSALFTGGGSGNVALHEWKSTGKIGDNHSSWEPSQDQE